MGNNTSDLRPPDEDAENSSCSTTEEEIGELEQAEGNELPFSYLQTEIIGRMYTYAGESINALTEVTNFNSLLSYVQECAEILAQTVAPVPQENLANEVQHLKSLIHKEWEQSQAEQLVQQSLREASQRLLTENENEKKQRLLELAKVEELKKRLKIQKDQNARLKKELITAKTDMPQLEDGVYPVDLATFNLRDVSHRLCHSVQHAVSLYNGDCCKRDKLKSNSGHYTPRLKEIKRVRVLVNRRLSGVYEEAKRKYRNAGSAMEEVYAYHATDLENVSSIIKTNLDPNRTPKHGRAYGFGCYFSEHPTFSLKYGEDCIFIFKILLVEGNYKKVRPDRAGFCQQLILSDVSMFKPVYVLYF